MKRIFTLLLLILSAFTFKAAAQSTTCNADFTWQLINGNTVKFTPAVNDSPLVHHEWNFGDGSPNSPVVAPIHSYAANGSYVVIHTVIRFTPNGSPVCTQVVSHTILIQQAPPCNLVANFSWTTTASNPLMIEFHNLSTPSDPTDSVRWNFGDGAIVNGVQGNPTVANPVHTYLQPGTYNVCIRVKKNNNTGSSTCVKELCKTVIIPQPTTCNLVANFSSQPDPNHPLRIKFTNLSVPLHPTDSVRWTFGDGNFVSGLQSDPNVANPTHNYANAGNYTVCLRVKQNINTSPNPCVREICKTIIVEQPCNFQVNFSWQLDQTNPRKVYFTNLTVAPTVSATATWYFGDGATANTWNAVHEYAQPGRYYVCLKIQTSNTCIKYKCDSILIPNPLPPCNNQSNFSVLSTAGNSQTLTFIPAFQNSAAVYTWTFGDGTGSHDMIATHHYAQPGIYNACLTVWRSATCASTTCKEVRVLSQLNCDTVHVTYSYQPDPNVPNKIHFYANSNVLILDQTWTIVKLPVSSTSQTVTLHQNNPTYLFPDTGYYRVCLRAVTLGGCIKEYCSVIHISQVSNACVLQAYPNPATNVVNVNVTLTQPETIHAYVYNSQSVLVRDKHQPGNTGLNVVSININDLPAGMYTIKLIYGNHICYAQFQKL